MTTAADLVGYWRTRAETAEAESEARRLRLLAKSDDLRAEWVRGETAEAALAAVCAALMGAYIHDSLAPDKKGE